MFETRFGLVWFVTGNAWFPFRFNLLCLDAVRILYLVILFCETDRARYSNLCDLVWLFPDGHSCILWLWILLEISYLFNVFGFVTWFLPSNCAISGTSQSFHGLFRQRLDWHSTGDPKSWNECIARLELKIEWNNKCRRLGLGAKKHWSNNLSKSTETYILSSSLLFVHVFLLCVNSCYFVTGISVLFGVELRPWNAVWTFRSPHAFQSVLPCKQSDIQRHGSTSFSTCGEMNIYQQLRCVAGRCFDILLQCLRTQSQDSFVLAVIDGCRNESSSSQESMFGNVSSVRFYWDYHEMQSDDLRHFGMPDLSSSRMAQIENPCRSAFLTSSLFRSF